MNDMEFIKTLKEKRNISQTKLVKELHISRQNLNEIENS